MSVLIPWFLLVAQSLYDLTCNHVGSSGPKVICALYEIDLVLVA